MDIKARIKRRVLYWILGITFSNCGIIVLVAIIVASAADETQRAVISLLAHESSDGTSGIMLDYEVLKWLPEVEYWTKEYGIEDWVMEVLAIMHVETGGTLPDLMQSSESAGMPPNTLQYEASIEQGVRYLSQIIARARSLGVEDDRLGTIQSYNFGIFYINHLAQNNKTHTLDVSENYSRSVVAPSLGNTDGQRISYQNPVAIASGRPWIYLNGGNFHYAYIVANTLQMMDIADAGNAFFVDGTALPMDPPFLITCDYFCYSNHGGIDLSVRFGAPVRSVLDGDVVDVVNHFGSSDGWFGHPAGYGNMVVVDHGGGIVTLYSHLMQEVQVRVGDQVLAGQVIGFQGNSGNSSGTHLHFEWREHGVRLNPELRINLRAGEANE